MEQRRSRSGAGAEPQRARILSQAGLIGVVVLVAGLLLLLFPKETLIEQVQRDSGNDELTENYLTSLIRTDPGNKELRLLLAEKKFLLRDTAAAQELLLPLEEGPDAAMRRRALLLEYRMLRGATWARPDSEARSILARRLLRMVEENWQTKELLYLLREARSVGAREVTRMYVERIAALAQELPPQVLAEAAGIALGGGEYVTASQLLLSARGRADTPELRRQYFRDAVAALQAGNMPAEALALAESNLGELAGDDEILLFLARLALAAGEPARAQVYLRKLMKLGAPAGASTRLPAMIASVLSGLLDVLVSTAHAQGAPLRPYDADLYNLAYEVFVANANLKDAFRVAQAAVAQRPGDMRWRERLAQVAEWSGDPQEALRQWVHIARGSGREDAYQAVLRLAPGLFDHESLVFAWRHVMAGRRLSRAELAQLVDTFEGAGQVDEGIAFFEEYHTRYRDPVALELLALLNERAGRADASIAAYERLIAASGASPERLVSLATLKLARADLNGAFRLLSDSRAGVPKDNEAFWQLLGDLAWELQEDDIGREAYRVLSLVEKPQPEDLLRLVLLLRAAQPAEAVRVAESAWQRHRDVQALNVALDIRAGLNDRAGLRRLYAMISAADEKLFDDNRFFFTQRAAFRAGDGDRAGALADWRRALAGARTASPQDLELRAGFLWFLIDGRMNAELRAELRALSAGERAAVPLIDSIAAAHLTLGEPRLALAYLRRQAPVRSGDYLWLMSYADTLEAAGEQGMALRMRRHAWETVRRAPDPQKMAKERDQLLAYVRLVTQFAPGDASLAAIRHVLRQDRAASVTAAAAAEQFGGTAGRAGAIADAAGDAAQASALARDATVRELVLAWAISADSSEAARAWRWNAYGRKLAAPVWADVSLALERRDSDTLGRLLETQADAIPALSRIDAARETRRLRLAQTLGFEAQERAPFDDELHLRLATDLLASASSIIVDAKRFQRGVLKGSEHALAAEVWVTPILRLSTRLVVVEQRSADAMQITGVPGEDRALIFSALLRHDRGDTELSAGRRSGLGDFTTLKLAHNRPLGSGVSASLGLALRERAGETLALYVGGHKDEASLAGQWSVSKREYLNARAWSARFHTQQDTYVGAGRGVYLEAGHRIRSEYPDWNVRVSRSISHYDAAVTSDAGSAVLNPAGGIPGGNFFLPQSSRTWGVSTGFGMDLRERYGRALRPFADIGRSVNSITGSGYNWLLGAGGSILGQDYLSFHVLRSTGGAGTNLAIRELALRYQYFFDRF